MFAQSMSLVVIIIQIVWCNLFNVKKVDIIGIQAFRGSVV